KMSLESKESLCSDLGHVEQLVHDEERLEGD
ncbi:hypothetical protein Tco_0344843, partial [Tanacetum coccineum]